MLPEITKERRLQTAEAVDPYFRVRSELQKAEPTSRLRYSNQFARDAHLRFETPKNTFTSRTTSHTSGISNDMN